MSSASLSLPTVTILIVNYSGAAHLPTCLDSLAALDYPRDRYDVLVVDNASTDNSLQLLADRYPWVRVLPQTTNLGFAEGNNVGAAAASSQCLALLNNDMEVDPSWLRELVAGYDPVAGYTSVASVILDWSGEKLDFADGVVNYYGMGEQVGFGRPLEEVAIPAERDMLFACGGAMLIERAAYLAVGGFDPAYFAYFEDVDLGWRLWLAGQKVRLAPAARVRHRHHGTSGSIPSHQTRLLYERNAIRTLIKNLGEEHVWRLVSAALLLLIERARTLMHTSRNDFAFGTGSAVPTEKVDREGVAALHGIGDLIADFDGLMEARRAVQSTRRRGDREIFPLFGRPFLPLGCAETPFIEAMANVTRALRLDLVFEERRATRVIVLAYDTIGKKMAGPGARCWELAKALARSTGVTVASATPIELEAPGVEVVEFRDEETLRALLMEADVVLLHGHALEMYPSLRTIPALKVIDLYDPWLFENLEHQQGLSPTEAEWMLRRDVDVQQELIDVGDFFICASERQRDYWLGLLTARGRVDRETYRIDPTLNGLIGVVPYGCPEAPPALGAHVLKGVHPQIPDDAFLILWSGGTWEWFDPLLVLEAFRDVVAAEPRARLYFMGLELPDRGVPPQRVARELIQRAGELGLAETTVVFDSWIPYEERGRYLAEADVAVVAARDLAESRLAFRSRVLDHFWTGLPTISTRGDVLSELAEREGAAITVAPGDAAGLRDAMLLLCRDDARRAELSARALALADRFRWSKVVRPVEALVAEPWRWWGARARRPSQVPLTEDAQLVLARQRAAGRSTTSRPITMLRIGRGIWWRTPEGLRASIRPLLRRGQAYRRSA